MTGPKRINVVGASGSGKSTFARKLAEKIDAPYIQLDQVFWKSNWQEPSDSEFFPKLEAALVGDRWVLDGNYNRTQSIKWKRIDMIIWIDLPFWLTFWQALKRAFWRAITQEELWPGTGNKESFRRSLFSKKSILLWTIQTHGPVRARYEALMRDPKFRHIPWVRLRSRNEIREFLRNFSR